MNPQAKKHSGSVKKMADGGTAQKQDTIRHNANLDGDGEELSSRGFGTKNALRNFRSAVTGQRPKPLGTQVSPRKLREQQKADNFMDMLAGITTCGPKQQDYANGGAVKDSKMSKKVAGFFAKKGNKKLAAHERREAAGKEEDTKSIAKQEERALKDAPADMKNYEKKEHQAMGFKKGGKVRPKKEKKGKKQFSAMMARAMAPPAPAVSSPAPDMGAMMSSAPAAAPPMGGSPGMPMGMKKGGGVESKGKTQGKMVKMASGGKCYARGGGIESKGKTRGRMC